MIETQVSGVTSIGGMNIRTRTSYSAEGSILQSLELPVSTEASLSTRTDASNGVITMPTDAHGYTTGDSFDLYFGESRSVNCTVDSVSSTDITFSAGTGADLPEQGDTVYVAPQVEITMEVDGAKLVYIITGADQRGAINFLDSSDASIAITDLYVDKPFEYAGDSYHANPFSGSVVDYAIASNSSSSAPATLKMGVLYDSTV